MNHGKGADSETAQGQKTRPRRRACERKAGFVGSEDDPFGRPDSEAGCEGRSTRILWRQEPETRGKETQKITKNGDSKETHESASSKQSEGLETKERREGRLESAAFAAGRQGNKLKKDGDKTDHRKPENH